MSFVSPFVENTSNDVRDLAYSIVAQVCIAEGESYTHAKQKSSALRNSCCKPRDVHEDVFICTDQE